MYYHKKRFLSIWCKVMTIPYVGCSSYNSPTINFRVSQEVSMRQLSTSEVIFKLLTYLLFDQSTIALKDSLLPLKKKLLLSMKLL